MPTYRQTVEAVSKCLPKLYVVTSLALIIETIDSTSTAANTFILQYMALCDQISRSSSFTNHICNAECRQLARRKNAYITVQLFTIHNQISINKKF